MVQKNRVLNFTKRIEGIEEDIERGTFKEKKKGAIKKEKKKKPNYRDIIKKDKYGVEKRHGMIIESDEEIYAKARESQLIEREERKRTMEENKDRRFDVNNMIKEINNKDSILTPTQAMEFLSNVVMAKITNANGIELGMDVRLKAANILKDYYKDLKPEDKKNELKEVKVTFCDLTDEERVEDIAAECGISKEELDEIKGKVK